MDIQVIFTIAVILVIVYIIVERDKKKKNKEKEYIDEQYTVSEKLNTPVNDIENIEVSREVINSIEKQEYIKPPRDLLKKYSQKRLDDEEINKKTNIINDTLKEFKLNAKVCNVDIGAQLSVYEIQLIGNTRVQKVMDLENDLKLALGVKNIKMINPVPGKPTIGVEIPNDDLTCIGLRQMLKDIPNNKNGIVLGKDYYGNTEYIEVEKINNVLIAGRPDSGKTLFLHNVIITTLLKTTPEEIKMVIIDPKRIEFNNYNNLPHLLTPVVTDSKKSYDVLEKLVVMMNKRYETFKHIRVKNIQSYNEYIDKELKENPNCGLKRMPLVLIIIDSYIDLVAFNGKNITEAISIIAQKGNLVGIHLIISVSRPSTDVMQGDIKINMPNRISFDLSSSLDSKTILDSVGAENLLGNGDMLCKVVDKDDLLRLQAPYISDEEIIKVVNYIKEKNVNFKDNIIFDDVVKTKKEESSDDKEDVLYDEILNYAIRMGQISASIIQRKYGIGYNRAAHIMDMFEKRGIVGPANGSKPRDVLVKYED